MKVVHINSACSRSMCWIRFARPEKWPVFLYETYPSFNSVLRIFDCEHRKLRHYMSSEKELDREEVRLVLVNLYHTQSV